MPRRLHQIGLFALTATLLLAGCRGKARFDEQPRNLEARHWVGVYASPSEIRGFTATTLAAAWRDAHPHRMKRSGASGQPENASMHCSRPGLQPVA